MTLSTAERDRRHELLQELVRDLELDALVLAGADYRGMANTYLVTATGGEALSTKPFDVYVIS